MELTLDVWLSGEGCTTLCFSGDLGKECRTTLDANSKIIHSFQAVSHFDAMTEYYAYMGWGDYTTEFAADKDPYTPEKE